MTRLALATPGPTPLQLDARGHLAQVLKSEPTAVRPRVLLFLLELADHRFEAARHIIDALVREHPNDPEQLALHAELELRLANVSKQDRSPSVLCDSIQLTSTRAG